MRKLICQDLTPTSDDPDVGVGMWQNVSWLKVAGIVLAAPILWVYAVLMLVYFRYLLFDGIRRSLRKTK